MDSKIIDGTDLSAQIKAEVKNHVKRLKSKMASWAVSRSSGR